MRVKEGSYGRQGIHVRETRELRETGETGSQERLGSQAVKGDRGDIAIGDREIREHKGIAISGNRTSTKK